MLHANKLTQQAAGRPAAVAPRVRSGRRSAVQAFAVVAGERPAQAQYQRPDDTGRCAWGLTNALVSLWERCGGGAPDQVQHAAPGRGADLHASRRYGTFGGRYVPETLIPALDELQAEYAKAQQDPTFKVTSRASPHHTLCQLGGGGEVTGHTSAHGPGEQHSGTHGEAAWLTCAMLITPASGQCAMGKRAAGAAVIS